MISTSKLLSSLSIMVMLLFLISSTLLAQQYPVPFPIPTDLSNSLPDSAFLGSTNLSNHNDLSSPNAASPGTYICAGMTDAPHNSSHQPGTINVVARTVCPIIVPRIYVQTTLQRKDCFLGFCQWIAVGHTNYRENIRKSRVQINSASTNCVNGKYRGVSVHYVVDVSGIYYETKTSLAADIKCN